VPSYRGTHRPALILPFAKKVFRVPEAEEPPGSSLEKEAGCLFYLSGSTNELDRANILAPGFTFSPPSPLFFCGGPESFRGNQRAAGGTPATTTIGSWEVVSSYSSATAPDLHGISCADPLTKLTKNQSQN
jgi:hypothetical protein